MKVHNAAALNLAQWLECQRGVLRVHHPMLATHPQSCLARKQMSGGSGLIGVVLDGGMKAARSFVKALDLFSIAVSWGGFESLALPRWNSAMPVEVRREIDLNEGFVRLSVGLEDVDDLQEDLDGALRQIREDE